MASRTRRHFLRNCATGLGAMWLGSTVGQASSGIVHDTANPLNAIPPQFAARAKRVIFLHMAGAPSQLELFDFKPELQKLDGQDCPASFLEGQRFAFIQGVPKLMGPQFTFQQHGKCGAWVSDRLPEFAKVVDDVTFVKTMTTDQFNHAPAELCVHTGFARLGYPGMGSWVTWGLGTENENLPGYMVLLSGGRPPRAGKALWGSGFLPGVYQGVQCRGVGSPILNVENPSDTNRDLRRVALDALKDLNEHAYQEAGDPETLTRISQYEMAFRMQTAVPGVMDIKDEPAQIHQLYGTEPGKESFGNNCLLARRLAEAGVRFIQLFHWGWDSHGAGADEALNRGFKDRCTQIDKAMAALITDLKQRGMLEDTLVVWGGEFGRTSMRENRNGVTMTLTGRDHNPNAFTYWMAGGGIKPGVTFGETDPIGYRAVVDPVSINDFHATMLYALGLDHKKLTWLHQGAHQRLTNITKSAKVVKALFA
ncbi:MAG: DUF1501 domain-containing protein [Chthoniobacteraceae bacterium]